MTTPTPDEVLKRAIASHERGETYPVDDGWLDDIALARELLAMRGAVRKFLRFAPSHPERWIRGVDKAELIVGQREYFTLIANLPEHAEKPSA